MPAVLPSTIPGERSARTEGSRPFNGKSLTASWLIVGYFLATVAYVVLQLLLLGERRWWLILALSCGAAMVLIASADDFDAKSKAFREGAALTASWPAATDPLAVQQFLTALLIDLQ